MGEFEAKAIEAGLDLGGGNPAATPTEVAIVRGGGRLRPGRCPVCKGRQSEARLIFYSRAFRYDAKGKQVPSMLTERACQEPFHRGGR